MRLLNPEFLILLLAIGWLWKRENTPKNENPDTAPCKSVHTRKSAVLLYWASVFMVLALTGPVIVRHSGMKKAEGYEATIALDLSYSMQAKDLSPSRFEAARETIHEILRKDTHSRFSLYGFTTRTLILSPPTTDHQLLWAALDSIVTRNILTHGTDMGNLLQKIAEHPGAKRILILFTDGGEERDLTRLTDIARKGDIRIITVGMASERGSVLEDEEGKKLKKSDGTLVVTRLNPLLRKLAERSGGLFLPFAGVKSTADAVSKAIGKLSERSEFSTRGENSVELFWIPLTIALVLILVAWVRIPAKILLLIPFLSLRGDAGLLDWYYIRQAQKAYETKRYREGAESLAKLGRPTLQSRFDQALMLYRQGAYREAIVILESLRSKNPHLKQKILFLLGNAYVRRERYDKARRIYRKALALGKEPDILHNLRLIEGKTTRKRKKPPAHKKGGKKGFAFATKQKEKNTQKESASKKSERKHTLSRPLGYRAYEIINEGYIDEKNPW